MDYKIRPVRCKLVNDGSAFAAPLNEVTSATEAIRLCRWYFKRESLPHERVILVLLNNRKKVLGIVRVAEGGSSGAALTPADVLRPVLVAGATAFIMAHNHPSGDPNPSGEDVLMTHAINEAAKVLGVPLLDHIVIAADNGGATSLAEIGAF